MDPKLLLVKIITLLYKESQMTDYTVRSGEIVRNAAATIKLQDHVSEFDRGREVTLAMRATALWMADNPADFVYDRAALLQRIRVNVGDDDFIYQAIEGNLADDTDQAHLIKQTIQLRGELRNHIDSVRIKEIVKKVYQQTHFNLDGFDVRSLITEVMQQFEPFTSLGSEDRVEGLMQGINLNDIDTAEEIIEQGKEELSAEGILRTGFQGINRMTGIGGFRRGECVVLGALQHNYKSGMSDSLIRHFAVYNKPFMRDPTKKPLLLHISTESELSDTFLRMCRSLQENANPSKEFDINSMTSREAALYVRDQLYINGYEVAFHRFMPSDTTFQSFVDLVLKYEAAGYEVHAAVVDYLNMFSKRGCDQGATGVDVRDLWRRIRNFCRPRGILFVSPHQLSPDAKKIKREGDNQLVHRIANGGYYDGCTTVDNEVDLEIYFHKVKEQGVSYLAFKRGKHRSVSAPVAEKDLYFVMRFHPIGAIRDDVMGPDSSLPEVGADLRNNQGFDDPFDQAY